jgi:hypothetical protein
VLEGGFLFATVCKKMHFPEPTQPFDPQPPLLEHVCWKEDFFLLPYVKKCIFPNRLSPSIRSRLCSSLFFPLHRSNLQSIYGGRTETGQDRRAENNGGGGAAETKPPFMGIRLVI